MSFAEGILVGIIGGVVFTVSSVIWLGHVAVQGVYDAGNKQLNDE